jgi:hypothetical protein
MSFQTRVCVYVLALVLFVIAAIRWFAVFDQQLRSSEASDGVFEEMSSQVGIGSNRK